MIHNKMTKTTAAIILVTALVALCATAASALSPFCGASYKAAEAFCLAPPSRAAAVLNDTAPEEQRAQDARLEEIVGLLVADLRDFYEIQEFHKGLDEAGIGIIYSPALSSETQDAVWDFLEIRKNRGSYYDGLMAIRDRLFSTMVQFTTNAYLIECVSEDFSDMLDASKRRGLPLSVNDKALASASGGRFATTHDMLVYLTGKGGQPPYIDTVIKPDAEHDVGIIRGEVVPRTAKEIIYIYARDEQTLAALNSRSEYIAALIAAVLFPEMGLPEHYDITPIADTRPFDAFIRLFYDYVFRLLSDIPPASTYPEFIHALTRHDEYERQRYISMGIRDKKGYFRALDVTGQVVEEIVQLNYLYLRGMNALSMMSPAATAWYETPRREQLLEKLEAARYVLSSPARRLLYDPFMGAEHPDVIFAAAA